MKTCILCKKEFNEYGNNPEPLARFEDGQCCDQCDDFKVIPARLKRMGYSESTLKTISQTLHHAREQWKKRNKQIK